MKMSFECELGWDDLQGEDNVRRHCLECGHDVYNLSGMSRRDATRLFEEHGVKPPCVRFVSMDGQIVHEGDPLAQLHAQRNGIRTLVAAAVAVHMGSVLLDGPLFIPFGGFLGIGCGTSTTGAPAPEQYEDPAIAWAKEDIDCVGQKNCETAAEEMLLVADAYAAGNDPARTYLVYRELARAYYHYGKGGLEKPRRGLEPRLEAAEAAVEALYRRHRANFFAHRDRKNWDGMSAELRKMFVAFPDANSRWGRWARSKEREMKDDGVWVEAPANDPPF